MARIQFSARIDTDLARTVEHMREHASTDRDERISSVIAAIDVLMASPLIGRPCEHGLRELVIGRGMRGYLALYHYDERMDLVRILAIRSQKESGYPIA